MFVSLFQRSRAGKRKRRELGGEKEDLIEDEIELNDDRLPFRVLLRVRMLFYIKHEIIGDYVQQIADGVNVRYVFWVGLVFTLTN